MAYSGKRNKEWDGIHVCCSVQEVNWIENNGREKKGKKGQEKNTHDRVSSRHEKTLNV